MKFVPPSKEELLRRGVGVEKPVPKGESAPKKKTIKE